ncbi:DnaJ subfamily C member 2 [Ananas comosus]|uniref:DnaJ subfamily C member 2 n=1 Tax=Ananas comosus TaxID=4615 RepID=A0A199UGW2_ANACO|nr:DnaJ subfamily C member 2 [Ananas comosus]
MEFIEEEARPRFVFRGGGASSSAAAAHGGAPLGAFSKLHALCCVSAAALLLLSAAALLRYSHSAPASLLAWGALSLLLAPFAPSSATGGDPRVGRGPPLPDPAPAAAADAAAPADRRNPSRRSRSRKPDHSPNSNPPPIVPKPPDLNRSIPSNVDQILQEARVEEEDEEEEEEGEREWTDEDFDLLKKQIAKHPVGEPQRWERIAEAFKRRHDLSSVISMAKSLPERKPDSRDSFQQFLKHRKPSDRARPELSNGDVGVEASKENGGWSPGEDLALLNALKAFPKDAPMRWEKIAAAVPGKSKALCMKRVTELKRDFRSSKASQSQS